MDAGTGNAAFRLATIVSALTQEEHQGAWYNIGTPSGVINALTLSRHCGARVRLFYGDPDTGEAWPGENDVCGYVRWSAGIRPCPLLVPTVRSVGGSAILTKNVVAVMTSPGHSLYAHPRFNTGSWHACEAERRTDDLRWEVLHNGSVHARFKTRQQAQRYRLFMAGLRMAK